MMPRNILKAGISLFFLVICIGSLFFLGLDASTFQGSIFPYKEIFQSILVFLSAWMIRYLIDALLWQPYKQRKGSSPPHLFVTLQNFCLFIIAVFIIIKGVFNQPLTSLVTMGGLVTAGIAFSLQSIIYDAFSGLILDIEHPYRVGDWVKVDNIEGKVFYIGWRATIIITADQQQVLVPNGFFLKGTFSNYNQPDDWYWQTLEIPIDYEVPVDRARRLVHTALLSVPNIHCNLCDVYAYQPTEGGITYQVRYAVKSHEQWRETRHQVIEAITRFLHEHSLNISTTLGEYNLSKGGKPLSLKQPHTVLETLQSTNLFKELPFTVLEELASKAQLITVPAGETIVKQGEETTSLYIIIEGISQVIIEYEDQSTEVLAHLKSKDYFGEYSLLLRLPRSATVVPKTDSLLIEINKEAIQEIFQSFPQVIEILSEVMSRNASLLHGKKQHHISPNALTIKQEILNEIRNIFKLD